MELVLLDTDFDLDFSTEVPADEMEEITSYIRRAARYMGMDADDLHRQILKEWCFNRKFGEE